MIYGYARCSTNESMQDIDRQIRELKQQGAEDKTIYREYESGTKTNRAELQKLLDIVKPGDTILATEVSRITRSTKQLCDIIELAKNRKIKLVLGSFVVDCRKELDPMTEGMLKMMGVFAELERNMISQRVKAVWRMPNQRESDWAACGHSRRYSGYFLSALSEIPKGRNQQERVFKGSVPYPIRPFTNI